MRFLYNFFVFAYPVGARLLSLKNEKARKWIAGRKNIFERLAGIQQDKKIIWVHCSSLGEFEQGRPLIEKIKATFSDVRIVLTFFSPSGYEIQKQYQGADYVFYLPMDSKENAVRFFDHVNPAFIIFIKYDFWYYYIAEAKKRNVPFILASGIFRAAQPFFKWYGNFHRDMLKQVAYFFVQDTSSAELLHSINVTNVAVTGDTRFDRVIEIAEQFVPVEYIQDFCGNHPVIVAGSTWTDDDEELDHYANSNPGIRFIIAPHDVSRSRINECLTLYKNSITYSSIQEKGPANIPLDANVIIIDCIGLLSRLYRYATIAYVGGGFGADGVHNVLEAAVYHKPVVFGPVYDKFIEATQLVERGGAFPVENALELEQQLNDLLNDELLYKNASIAASQYVSQNAGATKKIMGYIQEKRLFTT